jgi:hypothetical protein
VCSEKAIAIVKSCTFSLGKISNATGDALRHPFLSSFSFFIFVIFGKNMILVLKILLLSQC